MTYVGKERKHTLLNVSTSRHFDFFNIVRVTANISECKTQRYRHCSVHCLDDM